MDTNKDLLCPFPKQWPLLVVIIEQNLLSQAFSAWNHNCVDEIFQEEQSSFFQGDYRLVMVNDFIL